MAHAHGDAAAGAPLAKKLMNTPGSLVCDALEGLLAVAPHLRRLDGFPDVRRRPGGPGGAQGPGGCGRSSMQQGPLPSLSVQARPCAVRLCLEAGPHPSHP
jgi:hypothetical protein